MPMCVTTKPGIACCDCGVRLCQCDADDAAKCAVTTNTVATAALSAAAIIPHVKKFGPLAKAAAQLAAKHPAGAAAVAAVAVVSTVVFNVCYKLKSREVKASVEALDRATANLAEQSAELAKVTEQGKQNSKELTDVKDELKETSEKYKALLTEQQECQKKLQEMISQCGDERAALHDLTASNGELADQLQKITSEQKQIHEELKADNAVKNEWVEMLNTTVIRLNEAVKQIQDDFQGHTRLRITDGVQGNKNIEKILEEINSKFAIFEEVRKLLKHIDPHEQVNQLVELGKQNTQAQQNLIATQMQIQTGLADCLDSLTTALKKINEEMAKNPNESSIKSCEDQLQAVLHALGAMRSPAF